MPYTRQERNALHQNQKRMQIGVGEPPAVELNEGVPVLRSTSAGVVEYVKYNGVVYKKVLDKA